MIRLPTCVRSASLACVGILPLCAQGATWRTSLPTPYGQADNRCLEPSLSLDGMTLAFTSFATNLVPNDTNALPDIFVKNLATGQLERVSVGANGVEANGPSRSPRVSADGNWIAFESDATNLVAGDTNGYTDVFLYDRQNHRTTRVSIAGNGMQVNLPCSNPAVSADGRYTAFLTMAGNLVANDTNNYLDVYVHDRLLRQTVRASVSSNGAEGDDDCFSPAISGDGRYVAFSSASATFVAGDNNMSRDVFVRDLLLNTTELVSVGMNGAQANADSLSPVLGAGGRYVAFHSHATNLVTGDNNGNADVFRVDRNGMTMLRASVDSFGAEGHGDSLYPSLSADGQRVAFVSDADDLALPAGPFADVFVHDFTNGRTSVHSLSADGLVASEWNGEPTLSGDGRLVAWPSLASNLVGNDTNQVEDILVNEVSHHLTVAGPITIGHTTNLTLASPRDAGRIYVCLAAFNTQFGTPIGGRLFPLDNDLLLAASLGMPSVFGNFIGTLDGNGAGAASVSMPNNPGLAYLELAIGYVVLDPAAPFGLSGFANALHFQVF